MNKQKLLRIGGVLFMVSAALFAVAGLTGDGTNNPQVASLFAIGLILILIANRRRKSNN